MSHRKRLCVFAGLALLTMSAAGPAQARPRDDAMAGAYHCGGIGPSRQWLDCYYGAVQPVRAALRLVPVPDAQARLAGAPPPGTPQDQAIRDAVIRDAARCDGDDRAWLDCYYAVAQPMRLLLRLAPAPQHVSLAVAEASRSGREAELPAGNWFLGAGKGITARLKDYHLDRDGRFSVTLANGEVWRQTDGDVRHPHWSKPPESYVVIISRGVLGSTNLTVRGEIGLYKVERG